MQEAGTYENLQNYMVSYPRMNKIEEDPRWFYDLIFGERQFKKTVQNVLQTARSDAHNLNN